MTDNTSLIDDLLPCPLCRSKEVQYVPNSGEHYGYVGCAECGIRLSNNITGWDKNKHIAVARWNTRPKPKRYVRPEFSVSKDEFDYE